MKQLNYYDDVSEIRDLPQGFFDSTDNEIFYHREIEEYLDQFWDDLTPTSGEPDPETPETIEVYHYVPMKIIEDDVEHWAVLAIDDLLERIDEEFGPLDEPTETESIWRDHARDFVNQVVSDYPVWRHEPDAVITVDFKRWVADKKEK